MAIPPPAFESLFPQLALFPLHPIIDGRCACSDPACDLAKRAGKHPAYAWGALVAGEHVRGPDGCGYGIATGARSGIVVLEADSDEAEAWVLDPARGVPPTMTVRSGSGRLHRYFAWPGFHVPNAHGRIFPKLDFKGDGGFAVAPGSPHRSGATYEIVHDLPPAPAPAWLVEWLRAREAARAAAPAIQSYPGDVTEPEEREHRRTLYRRFLEETDPCVEGEGGDQRLFDVVQRGAYDFALPTEDVVELVAEVFDPRCRPPWGPALEGRVLHKAHDAKTRSTRPRAEPVPRDLAHLVLEAPPRPPPKPRVAGATDPEGFFWDAWDVELPPVQYLIEGLIPVETVGMLVAMGSSLKTWTALSMAAAIARGVPWLGRFATRQGRVLIADYESGLYEVHRRVQVLEGRGVRVPGFGAWAPPALRLDDVKFWEKCAEAGGPGLALLIIDSLAAGAPGIDENTTLAATPLHYAARFTDETKAAVLFIHHAKKDSGGDDRASVRGSTAIYNACDWAYRFEQVEETQEARRMHMVNIKPGPGKRPLPVPIELTDQGLRTFEATDARPIRDAGEAEIQTAIRVALASGPIENKVKIAARIGQRRLRVDPEVDALVTRREIALVKGLGYVLDGPQQRATRVLALVRGYAYWKTPGALAKAASVDAEEVDALIRQGALVRSGDGSWIVVER